MLLRAGEIGFPFAPQEVFGRPGLLVLEVGFGDARFTAGLAKLHPEWNILGAEVSAGSVVRALKRMRREGIENVRLFHGQAGFALRNLVPRGGLYRVYVNFPDPWPKSKHQQNRLLQRGFFQRLSTRLQDGGALLLTTDHQEYWEFAQQEAKATSLFRVETPLVPEFHLSTKYALKWKEAGRNFYHAVFTKEAEDKEPWPPLARYPMPHAVLSGKMPKIENFQKVVVPFEGGHAILLEAVASLGGEGYYFLAHIEEQDLTQDVLLEVRPSANGIYAGIGRFGAPLSAGGVRASVKWLVEWLETKGLQVIQRSY